MNNKIIKTGILIVLLVIPVFVFLFLNIFGDNKYDLPYYFPKMQESGHPVIEANGDTVFAQSPEFQLIDQEGEAFVSNDLNGKPFVINFFFTRCGLICPTMSENLARVLDNQVPGSMTLVSVTIDPEHDSVLVLKNYADQFVGDNSDWHFLTGDKQYIYDLAIKGFKLPVSDASEYDKNLSIDETFIHSEKLLLIDSKGYFRGIYDGTNVPDVERLMVELDILRQQDK